MSNHLGYKHATMDTVYRRLEGLEPGAAWRWAHETCDRIVRTHCIGCTTDGVDEWARAWCDGETWAHEVEAAGAAHIDALEHDEHAAAEGVLAALCVIRGGETLRVAEIAVAAAGRASGELGARGEISVLAASLIGR